MKESHPVRTALAHANNPTAANRDPGGTHFGEGVEPILERTRRDDLPVIFGRAVDIVIVIIEPGVGKRRGLIRRQHAERHARFQPHRLDARDHRADLGHVAVLRAAPGSAHTEALRSRRLGLRCRGEHRLDVHQLLGLEPAVGRRRLAAVAAILRAAAGLDGQQGT